LILTKTTDDNYDFLLVQTTVSFGVVAVAVFSCCEDWQVCWLQVQAKYVTSSCSHYVYYSLMCTVFLFY